VVAVVVIGGACTARRHTAAAVGATGMTTSLGTWRRNLPATTRIADVVVRQRHIAIPTSPSAAANIRIHGRRQVCGPGTAAATHSTVAVRVAVTAAFRAGVCACSAGAAAASGRRGCGGCMCGCGEAGGACYSHSRWLRRLLPGA
jgi:hypothetical protein